MHVMIAAFREKPPSGTAAWRPDEVEFRSLAFDVEAGEAAGVVRRYAAAHPDWQVLTVPAVIAP